MTTYLSEGLTSEAWEEAGRRLMAARAVGDSSRPKSCPNCDGDDLFPTFDPDAYMFECNTCGNVWRVD